MNKAVFLDRDGVLNIDKGFVYRVEDFEFTICAPDAVKLLNDAGYKVIVVSNQSGIGRGFYTMQDVKKMQRHITSELAKYKAHIDRYYYCPHAPEDNCNCRKPKPRLLLEAARQNQIDLSQSFMIGDRTADIVAGKSADCKTIGVLTGEAMADRKYEVEADIICSNLWEAVNEILRRPM